MHLEIIHTLFALTNRFAKNLKEKDPRKSQDQISQKVLRMCSSQLHEIFCTIFNLSFLCGAVPDTLKRSCIVSVPKKYKVGSLDDLRPVGLTSVALETNERIVLRQLKSFIQDSLVHFNLHTKIIEVVKTPS